MTVWQEMLLILMELVTEIDKYFESEDADGKYYNFDPSVGEPPPIFGLGLLHFDKFFGGPERRDQ